MLTDRLIIVNQQKPIPLPESFLDDTTVQSSGVEVFIEPKSAKEILEFLRNSKYLRKFRQILSVVLQGKYNKDLYGKEDLSGTAEDVTAMKFKGKPNTRIYCKEFFLEDGKKVVMVEFLGNKDKQKATSPKVKSKIEATGRRHYEF